MMAASKTAMSSPLLRGSGKQKIFPKPDIKRLRIVGGKPSAILPKAVVLTSPTSELGVASAKTIFCRTLTLTGALTKRSFNLRNELIKRNENYETAKH